MSQLIPKIDQLSDSETDDTSKITDPTSCLDYLTRREVYLYKMLNDPSHKAMLYFLEVLMNSEHPLTVDQLSERFSNKSFSVEMREACGGGSVEALKEFLLKYPSLFTVKPTGLVSAVAIEMPGFDEMSEGSIDVDHIILKQNQQNTTSPEPSSSRPRRRTASTSSIEATEDTAPGKQPTQLKSSLKNSTKAASSSNEVKPLGIYQPPILRAQAAAQSRGSHICEICSIAAHMVTTSEANFIHCPFTDLNSIGHNYQTHEQRLSQLLKHAHTTKSHCCCSSDFSSSCGRTPSCKLVTCPQMAKFALERQAVAFFQQRLSRREERWVLIRSLAGHLSQASAEVRSIVGPQLEFRRFLLKHPHVFEVQGDLVGLRDSFVAPCLLTRRPKSFAGNSLNSLSVTSLPTLNFRGAGASQKVSRPKSLIMPSHASSTVSAPILRRLETLSSESENNFTRRNGDSVASSVAYASNAPADRHGSSNIRPRINGSTQNSTRNSATQNDAVSSSAPPQIRYNRVQELDTSVSTSGSICIRMSANEYRAIMFLRKVLARKGKISGQVGLSYMQLMRVLSAKAPETVQNVVGWTKVELEEFILRHPIFFEVRYGTESNKAQPGNCVTWVDSETPEHQANLVTNRRVLKMINIVITGNKPVDTGIRTMTNQCGRIFHVSKLWGIIDLGKHEHVFFDKSILKYVDDLHKHFKVNETLYFNAILAPKESRAKWRATQVWKECDKEIMEKLGVGAISRRTGTLEGDTTPINTVTTAAEVGLKEKKEIETTTTVDSDSSDYDLDDEEEVEEELGSASAIARAEGLNLANDIKFLSDDVEAELKRILGPNQAPTIPNLTFTNTTTSTSSNIDINNEDNQTLNDISDEDTSITGYIDNISIDLPDPGSFSEKYPPYVTSTTQEGKNLLIVAADSPLSERSSIAVQTLSTGDIMATQIFHDMGT